MKGINNMKEKDIVDFTKFNKDKDGEYIDEKGEEVGCEICYTHKKAYEYFDNDLNPENMQEIPVPRCPVCGKPMIRRYSWISDGNAVVSEVNYSNPEGNIGLYSIWECETETCINRYGITQIYDLMPIPIGWNANHDIYYTGGKNYLESTEFKDLLDLIKLKVMPLIISILEE